MATKKTNIIPIGDRVVVRPLGDEEGTATSSGIIIPDTVSKEKSEQGVVVAVGEGRTTDEGKIIPIKVKKGDRVLFSKYGPDEVVIDNEEYFVLSESSILAIIK
ncbi:MAG: co-chaperone GroES [Candidatus Pacebacteria bacterium]|nr:co-chaperone GroES [Candidatus Paceibacterota bacterium]